MAVLRRARLASFAGSAAALTLVLGACAASGSAGWTYAPEPSVTPAPSASGSPAASGSPVASATASASTAPSGSGGTGGSGGAALQISAQNIAFSTTTLSAPAGQAFAIDFDNEDAGIPHNIEIKDSSGASKFMGTIVTGPTKTTYNVPALAAGTYTFICDVHPTIMMGTLTVK